MSSLIAAALLGVACQKTPKTLQEWVETIPKPTREILAAQTEKLLADLAAEKLWGGVSLRLYEYKDDLTVKLSWQQRAAYFLNEVIARKGKAKALVLDVARMILFTIPVLEKMDHYPEFSRHLIRACAAVAQDADPDLRLVAVWGMHNRSNGGTHPMADRPIPLSPEEKGWVRTACTKLLNDPVARIAEKAKEAVENLGK